MALPIRKIVDGTYEVVSFSRYDEDKDKMVDGIDEYKDEDLEFLAVFCSCKE